MFGGAFGYLADYILWWLLVLSLVIHTWCFFRFFPRERFKRSSLLLGNTLIFFCLLGLAAIIGESYFRFLCVETDSFGVSLPARRWFALHTTLNSLGFRDDEWSQEKPEGVRRIAFVGDSFTYGWGVEREDRFTDLIQARFDAVTPGTVEIMNVAKSGWSTREEIDPIAHLLNGFDVDEIVLCYLPNDIEDLLPTTPDFNPLVPPEPTFFDPDRSPLWDFLYRRVYLPRLPVVRHYDDWLADGFSDPAIWREHQQDLGTIINECRDAGATLRVALLPFIRTSGKKYNTKALHAVLEDFFETNNVPVVDLAQTIAGVPPNKLVVNAGDAHPNAMAHRLFADAISSAFFNLPEPDPHAD